MIAKESEGFLCIVSGPGAAGMYGEIRIAHPLIVKIIRQNSGKASDFPLVVAHRIGRALEPDGVG